MNTWAVLLVAAAQQHFGSPPPSPLHTHRALTGTVSGSYGTVISTEPIGAVANGFIVDHLTPSSIQTHHPIAGVQPVLTQSTSVWRRTAAEEPTCMTVSSLAHATIHARESPAEGLCLCASGTRESWAAVATGPLRLVLTLTCASFIASSGHAVLDCCFTKRARSPGRTSTDKTSVFIHASATIVALTTTLLYTHASLVLTLRPGVADVAVTPTAIISYRAAIATVHLRTNVLRTITSSVPCSERHDRIGH